MSTFSSRLGALVSLDIVLCVMFVAAAASPAYAEDYVFSYVTETITKAGRNFILAQPAPAPTTPSTPFPEVCGQQLTSSPCLVETSAIQTGVLHVTRNADGSYALSGIVSGTATAAGRLIGDQGSLVSVDRTLTQTIAPPPLVYPVPLPALGGLFPYCALSMVVECLSAFWYDYQLGEDQSLCYQQLGVPVDQIGVILPSQYSCTAWGKLAIDGSTLTLDFRKIVLREGAADGGGYGDFPTVNLFRGIGALVAASAASASTPGAPASSAVNNGGPNGAAIAAWDLGRLDLFMRGADNTLRHKFFNGTWSEWENLGGFLLSDPGAVSWGPGRIDVFVRGADNAVWHLFYDNGWGVWESLGGVTYDAPTVTSWGPGRLDVVAHGADKQVWHRYFDGVWSGWEPLGAP